MGFWKRLFCGALAVLLVALLLPVSAAAEEYQVFLSVDGKQLYRKGDPYAETVAGAAYDPATGTLTLSGYSGRGIIAQGLRQLTIVLQGKNTILPEKTVNDSNLCGIQVRRKDGQAGLTITGGGALELRRVGTSRYVASGIDVYGPVEILGGSQVSVNARNGYQVFGVSAQDRLYVDTARGSSLEVQLADSRGMMASLSVGNVFSKKTNTRLTTSGSAVFKQGDRASLCRVVKDFTYDGWRQVRSPYIYVGKQVNARKLSLNMQAKQLKPGQSVRLKATVSPADASDKSVTWRSSNAKVATVSANGTVRAVGKGKCSITARTANGKKAACAVSVGGVAVRSVKLAARDAVLGIGQSLALKPGVVPRNAANRRFACASSDKAVATVSQAGVVTARGAGSCTITVTSRDGAKQARCTVTVVA